jgi:hypothetical protein
MYWPLISYTDQEQVLRWQAKRVRNHTNFHL